MYINGNVYIHAVKRKVLMHDVSIILNDSVSVISYVPYQPFINNEFLKVTSIFFIYIVNLASRI